MPQNILVDKKFIGGLKTEFTGLNFPEDACTETFNCVFQRTGQVDRRLGFDYELNATTSAIDNVNLAVSSYWWKTVIGDSTINILVVQVGTTLYFYKNSSATIAVPLSTTKLASTVLLTDFGNSPDPTAECQYADGNGFLFVFHPNCEPIAVSYTVDVLSGSGIQIKIRDMEGIVEAGVGDTFRSNSLTATHQYNLQNQGWGQATSSSSSWTATSTTSNTFALGNHTWTIQPGLTISNGQIVNITGIARGVSNATGTVISYAGTTLILDVTSADTLGTIGSTSWTFSCNGAIGTGNIFSWNAAIGNYPSNSDSWWMFKNSSGVFSPSTTISNVTLNSGPSPKGFYILEAFNQQRSAISGVAGLATVITGGIRPSTGCWFQGRVWYSGVNFRGLNEKVYFSQIIQNSSQFGKCYQINDPTSQDRFDLLPSDGGVVVIQGSGIIHKLVPIVNGLLVFAERGVWFITGSQGIGFTATDYTITKISPVPTISATSFVDVLGYPMWWNEDGIYSVTLEQGGLQVKPITFGTIATFYQNIPSISRKYARGIYNPIEYKVQWLYRDTSEDIIFDRYTYSNILNLDTVTGAFYPWTITSANGVTMAAVTVIGGPGGTTSPPTVFKYITFKDGSNLTFSEERRTDYLDWSSAGPGADYESYFITGYRIYGQANKKGQIPYIDIHSAGETSECDLQARWDFSTSGNTGRWSSVQRILFTDPNYAFETKRRRIRGQGKAVQLKFSSVTGHPMSLIGWSTWVNVNEVP